MSRSILRQHRLLKAAPTATGLPWPQRPPRCFATTTSTASSNLTIHPISGSLGAEIHGVKLRSLDKETAHSIRQAWLQHKVIFFRDQQDVSPSQFLEFSRLFGKAIEYPFVKGIEGYPEIIRVLKREEEKVNFGGVWHSDTVYLEEPPMGTMLLAQEIPPFGGDTLFANQTAAYRALSPALQSTLATLTAVNTSAKADASKTREDRIKDTGHKSETLTSRHPVVRTHPETGEKSLYVNVAHTERFDGWTAEESKPLLDFLHAHQVRPEFTARFRWGQGSLAFWDNRCALHNPINDYHGYRRSMLRITLEGDRPR